MTKNDKKDLFNLGAKLFHRLFVAGQTEVSKFISTIGLDVLLNMTSSFDVFNCSLEDDAYFDEIARGDYLNSLKYLIALDNECSNNLRLIEYIKSTRNSGSNLADDPDVLIFPEFDFVDHYYKAYDRFQTLFSNLYFLETSVFGNINFIIHNYYINDIYSSSALNVAFIPYPIDNSLNARLKSDINVDYFKQSDLVFLNRLKNVLLKIEKDIPALVFSPEMVGNKALDSEIEIIAKNNKDVIGFLCPSYIRSGSKKTNSSTLFINEDRTTLTEINNKYRPVDEELKEGICCDTITLNVIHIKGFGKILSIICRDFLTDTFKKIIDFVLPDVILIQCYTKNVREFKNKMYQVCEANICVISGNACSTLYKASNKKPVVIYGIRNKYDEENNVDIKESKHLCEKCASGCIKNNSCNVLIQLKIINNDSDCHRPRQYISIEIKEDI